MQTVIIGEMQTYVSAKSGSDGEERNREIFHNHEISPNPVRL